MRAIPGPPADACPFHAFSLRERKCEARPPTPPGSMASSPSTVVAPYRFVKEWWATHGDRRFVVREVHRLRTWNGTTHCYRIDNPTAPAQREWEVVDGQRYLVREGWYQEGRLHRENGPAFRRWALVRTPTGNIERQRIWEVWYQCGVEHRIGGPARRIWQRWPGDLPYPAYFLAWEEWAQVGNMHRVGGPAFQHWACVGGVVTLQEERYDPPLPRVEGVEDMDSDDESSSAEEYSECVTSDDESAVGACG